MNLYQRSAIAALFGLTLAGCSGGGSSPTCSLDDPAQLPPAPQGTPGVGSAWPKFRANLQNTGTVNNVTVPATGTMKCFPASTPCFPAPDPNDHKGNFVASPVLNNGETFIYIGSTDNNMYRLSTADLTQDIGFNLFGTDVINSTALVAVRDGQDAIFVGSGAIGIGTARLYGVAGNSALQASYWPFIFNTFVSASPTLYSNGTVQVGAQSGAFAAVCPNGIATFILTTAGIQSSAAISSNGTAYLGTNDGELHAFEADNGASMWAFSASGPLLASPVIEGQGTDTFVYVADRAGHVFKVDGTNGRQAAGFVFAPTPAAGPIWSSPALGNQVYMDMTDPQNPTPYTHLYFGSDDGNLYAIRTNAIHSGTSGIDWQFHTDAPIVASPAVAIDAPPGTDAGTANVVVVVKSNDGYVYFLRDNGIEPPTELLKVQIDEPNPSSPPTLLASSPAIGADGTVYIGSDGGRVYAIK